MASGQRNERELLRQAWKAFAAADFQGTCQALPTSLTDFGSAKWSYAAEAALIYALVEYARGDLNSSLVHARMAQSGLEEKARGRLLLPSLLVQALIAFHRRHRDLCESLGQIASHLPTNSERDLSWQSCIAAISQLSSGSFEKSKVAAQLALDSGVASSAHEAPHGAFLVLAHIARDIGDHQQASKTVADALTALDDFPFLPIHVELLSLKAHLALDLNKHESLEAIEAVAAMSSHPLATPELQDLIDCLEAGLRLRTNELTRAKVLSDRIEPSTRRTILQCAIDAESRPSRTLGVLAAGGFRWYRHQIETEVIRARARRKDLQAAARHWWRGMERAVESQSVRPFLDLPLGTLALSNPDFLKQLEQTRPSGEVGALLGSHLEKVLQAHSQTALLGPETHALSARELEILRAVEAGGDFNTIAKILVLSRWTVRGHFYSACRKLGVSGKDGAMARLRDIEAARPHCSSS